MIEIIQNEPHPHKAMLAYHGISQQQLATALGISQGHLSNLLNGHREMPEKIDKEISELLKHLEKSKKRKLN